VLCELYRVAARELCRLTPSCTFASTAHLQHDKDLLEGKNLPESYTAEVLKLAFTNHWHFGHKAVRSVGRPAVCVLQGSVRACH
jgi:hypothetical protein